VPFRHACGAGKIIKKMAGWGRFPRQKNFLANIKISLAQFQKDA